MLRPRETVSMPLQVPTRRDLCESTAEKRWRDGSLELRAPVTNMRPRRAARASVAVIDGGGHGLRRRPRSPFWVHRAGAKGGGAYPIAV